MEETDNRKCPPKRAIAPSHQAQELTRITNWYSRSFGQEDAPVVPSKTSPLHDLTQNLQRETSLPQRPAEDHQLIGLMLRREAAVEQPRHEDGVVGDGQRHGQADEEVRDDNDRDLLGLGQGAVPADDAASCGRSESRDQGQENGRRDAGHAGRFDADEEVRDSNASGDRHGGVDPPEHVRGLAPPIGPLADDGQGDHLDNGGESDRDGGQAGRFDDNGR